MDIFCTGTMRSGGSLLQNALAVHDDISIYAGLINFFRFYDDKYGQTPHINYKRIIGELDIRLRYRKNISISVKKIIELIESYDEITYPRILHSIFQSFDENQKTISGEYATNNWKNINKYLDYFPHGKVIQIIRDPRAVVSSLSRITIMPGDFYLHSIVNWLSAAQSALSSIDNLPKDRYLLVRFEDIHIDPPMVMNNICEFIGVKFNSNMLQPEKWPSIFDGKYVDANISGYSGKKVYGYDSQRAHAWKNHISTRDLLITESILGEYMGNFGYHEQITGNKLDKSHVNVSRIIDNLVHVDNPADGVLRRDLKLALMDKKGVDRHLIDPTDPVNWDSTDSTSRKFVDSDSYQSFLNEMTSLPNE